MENPLLLLKLNFASDLKALWTFAALFIVIASAFATRSRTLLLLLPRIFQSGKSANIPHPSSFSYSDDDDDDSCSDDDDSDDEEEDDNQETTPPLSSEEEFHGQYGNFDSVVKFWDEAFRSGPPSSVSTAEEEEADTGGHLAVVRLWDARSAGVVATWRTEGAVVAVGFGRREERVYVGDGVGRVTVVDLRNVKSAIGESWRPERHAFPVDGVRKEDKLMMT